MELKQLLNSLIERGWKPFGMFNKLMTFGQNGGRKVFGFGMLGDIEYSIREIVSRESGLWQFCEENKMLIGFSPRTRTKNAHETYGSILGDIEYWGSDYEYRLIESSLRDESELESFILDNIKVDVGSKQRNRGASKSDY